METSQPLSIESFSYSWLVNQKPPSETLDDSRRFSLDASDEAYFIEMDLQSPASKRFFTHSQDLNFDFPVSQSPLSLVHADELISNGFLMPFFVSPLKVEAHNESYSHPTTPTSSRQCVGNYEAEDLAPEMKLLIQLWLTPVIIGAGLVILIAQYTKQSSTAKDQLVNRRGYCEKKRRKICQREEMRGLKMIITRYSASVVLASLPLDDNQWLSFMGSRSSIHDKTLNFLHLGRGRT
ncbi:hypothetical protein Vadar_013898 [Vaccinium darrowii]|uniref:Uncharacterized protein n=1 Tax=Vaccinium darrowii TaxID=229202 RepID=A0ACB7XHB2_9ERIC|nr:hypothetical protein Vadar_013898 [Vaccinium darrowii]